ncbi:MAG: ATP-dependent DNA helicase RecG [Actinomycetota bacterium]|nr:ATP-dependent DNA helicase RecG [Actinomycetota bacterium]
MQRRRGLQAPLVRLLGDRSAKALAAHLDLRTVEDLLRHYPRRYALRGELTDLSALRPDELVTVLARVESVFLRTLRPPHRSVLEVVVTDGHGKLRLAFFNSAWRQSELRVGRSGMFSGRVGVRGHSRQLVHPEYQLFDEGADLDAVSAFASEIIPVYPAVAKVTSWRIATCVRTVLDTLGELPDPLPEELRRGHGLLGLREALEKVHRPRSRADVAAAQQRLRWEEAFLLQVLLAQSRAEQRELPAIPRVPRPDGLLAAFDAAIPFELTAGQRTVSAEILADLARRHPMRRLLQGEVGAGKTVVALRGMLATVDAGGQAVLLAPTEVLAQQHFRSLTALLGPLAERGRLGSAEQATRVALLTGSLGAAARRSALLDIASGAAGLVVGTHALLEDPVSFADLGLVVVDEQHRFGVEQRDALREKAASPPHLLVMTATPIPRTVAMTVFGDLEVSTLQELPRGRVPIRSSVVPALEKPAWLDRAWARVREEVAGGRQAYVVCPRIGGEADDRDERPDGDDAGQGAPVDANALRRPPLAVVDVAPLLQQGPLAGLRVEVLHGRLPAEGKDTTMTRFARGEVDVLVATTVIEVGVDVSNATVMVVLDADRFGISQLHQLRGRIGRGGEQGLCLLVTDLPSGTPAVERLDAVAATLDGFELSRLDLEQRREGDVLGASQSGRRSSLRLLSVLRDEELLQQARAEATAVVEGDPELDDHPELAAVVAALVRDQRAEYLDKS